MKPKLDNNLLQVRFASSSHKIIEQHSGSIRYTLTTAVKLRLLFKLFRCQVIHAKPKDPGVLLHNQTRTTSNRLDNLALTLALATSMHTTLYQDFYLSYNLS